MVDQDWSVLIICFYILTFHFILCWRFRLFCSSSKYFDMVGSDKFYTNLPNLTLRSWAHIIMWAWTEHMFSFIWQRKWAQTQFPSAHVGLTRETTWTHLLSIDSRIPFPSRWSTILSRVQLVLNLRGPLNSVREPVNHEAKTHQTLRFISKPKIRR